MRYIAIAIGLLLPAVASAQVAITEVRWSGSEVSTADEWLRLQNVSDGEVDLSGWQLTTRKSDGTHEPMITFAARSLGVGKSLLISNYTKDKSALMQEPDLVTTAVSLPNSKLLLRVLNADGAVVDEVDDGVGAPFAGSKDPYASMLRTNPKSPGTSKENWYTAGQQSSSSSSSESYTSFASHESHASDVSSLVSSITSSSQSSETAGVTPIAEPLPADNGDVRITAIIPKPPSGERGDQQIFLEYAGGRRATLDGWTLDNRAGGSDPIALDGITLEANGSRVFSASWLGISFTPERDTARLIAPDGTVVSMLAWNNPAPWQTVRPVRETLRRMPVEVVAVADETIHIRLTAKSFVGLLPRVERYWAQSAHKYLHPSVVLRLTGISMLRGKHIPVDVGDTLYLDPQAVTWQSAPVISAYVYDTVGNLLQHRLLNSKQAVASTAEPHPRTIEFAALNESSSSVASAIVLAEGKSSIFEQKSYSNKSTSSSSVNPVSMLPVRYVNIQPAEVVDPRENSSSNAVDTRISALVNQQKQIKKNSESRSSGLPWALLFSQSALWVLCEARRIL